MPAPILIAYATCFGSTKEVAQAIADTLEEKNFQTEVKACGDVTHVESYQAVILGSAVQHGAWLPEAISFATKNVNTLTKLPLAIFSVHITNVGDDEQSRHNREVFTDDVRVLLNPQDEIFFAGKFDRQGGKLMLPKAISWLVPKIDLRKWDKIRAWAESLPEKLHLQMIQR